MPLSNPQIKIVPLEETYVDRFANFELEFKRIENLVDESVTKLKFAMTIPRLVDNDFALIKPHLTQDQLEMVKQVFGKYLPSESLLLGKTTTNYAKLTSLQNINQIEDYFNTYITRSENIPQRDEYDFSNALHLLYNNENIRNMVDKEEPVISEAGFNFVQDMKMFMYSIVEKMRLSPEEAEGREVLLRTICVHQHHLTDEAHILEEEAVEEVRALHAKLKNKLDDVLSMKQKCDTLMEECRNFIQKSGGEANKKMIFNWKSCEHQQEQLEKKVLNEMVDLDLLRKKYVEEEKHLRIKRYKTEQHLIAFLDQYDKDMQNKQNELDRQNEIVVTEKEQYDELNEQFQEQGVVYDMLMKEKAQYEQKLFEAKLFELKCSVSARKIQRFYKNFKKLLRYAGKKDLLKNKKKRKS